MFHEEVRLLLAAASMQGEVQVKLYRVHPRESVGQSSRLIEDPTRIRVISFRRHHQKDISAFPNCLQLQIIAQAFWRYANIGGHQLLAHIPLIGLKTTRQGECMADAPLFAELAKGMSEGERFLLRKTAEYSSVLEIVCFQLLGKDPKELARSVEGTSLRVTYYETVILKTAKHLRCEWFETIGLIRVD